MQKISNLLVKNKLLFSRLEPIPLKALGSRKHLQCYFGVNLNKEFGVIFVNPSKTRILSKELKIMEDLVLRVETIKGCRVRKKILCLQAPICSKASLEFKKTKWRVLHVLV